MKTLALLVIHLLTMLAKRLGPGGAKAIIAESVLIKHQQLIVHRSIRKTPRLTTSDRFLCGFLVLFMHPRRIRKAAIVLKPATLTKFRSALLSRNYHRLFSSRKNAKPGPKGPSDNLVRVIVEMKQRNTPVWLSPDRSANQQSIRSQHRQRRSQTCARQALSPEAL